MNFTARLILTYRLNAARFGKEIGCEKFIIVSSIGANSHSSTFYLRLKGEVENAIQLLDLGLYISCSLPCF